MSRNKEKAQAGLNRYYDQKSKEAGALESNPSLRPKYVQSEKSLPQAEKWRSTIMTEISVKLTRISDSSTSDFVLRELNDSLNKLFKEKRAWEYHIKSLGGVDYISYDKDFKNAGVAGEHTDESGKKIQGYRYFGRAKNLPDVKILLESKAKSNNITETKNPKLPPLYYGYGIDTILSSDSKKRIVKNSGKSKIDYIEYPVPPKDELLKFEQKREQEILQEIDDNSKVDLQFEFQDFEKVIPPNDVVYRWIVDKKKQELMKRLGLEDTN